MTASVQNQQTGLIPISFSEIRNWADDDHLAALICFQLSAERMVKKPYSTKPIGVCGRQLAEIAEKSLSIKSPNQDSARKFFEENFTPHQLTETEFSGLLTGYYEPILNASKIKTDKFQFPLYRRPEDLIDINDQNRPDHIDNSFAFARQTENVISYYSDRGEIQEGALEGKGLELFWLQDPIDVFFIHIQGSARLVFDDGSQASVSFSAKTGHPYTAIGNILVGLKELKLIDVTMSSIRQWLIANPNRQKEIFAFNQSYIFFQQTDQNNPKLGPVAAAGVPLTPGRSLAVDRQLHTFGTPIWVETKEPIVDGDKSLSSLLIAQDTGSAIIGAERGDFFVGSGEKAGVNAGKINHRVSMTILEPNSKSANSGSYQTR